MGVHPRDFFSGIWVGIDYHVKRLFIIEVFPYHLSVINAVKWKNPLTIFSSNALEQFRFGAGLVIALL